MYAVIQTTARWHLPSIPKSVGIATTAPLASGMRACTPRPVYNALAATCHTPRRYVCPIRTSANRADREALNDNFHIAHEYSDVSCISCHPAPQTEPEITEATTGDILVTIPAPNHDFVTVSANSCVDCHSQEIGQNATIQNVRYNVAPVELVEIAERVPVLTAELKAAERENGTLAATSVVSLGLGIGTGGVLGILFVLVIGFVAQRRSKR